MEAFEEDVKKAVVVADKFLSVTLARESLSPEAEKERSLLAGWFKKLKIQLGASTESTENIRPPPRPAKGGAPVPIPVADEDQDQGTEDIYDDVKDDGKVQDEYYSEMADGVGEGPGNANQNATEHENYEAMDKEEVPGVKNQGNMPGQNYEVMESNCNQESQENYEEPQQNQINEDYEISGDQPSQVEQNYEVADTTTEQNYEVAELPASTGNETGEGVETYEGVDGPDQTSGEGLRDSSSLSKTIDWKNLTKNVKPGEIEGVITKGTLWKHRKEGKFFVGSKWQKRFCVLRSSVLYYFKDKSSDKQQGQVLLPGYKVETVDRNDREFKLTMEGGRSFKFYASSEAEAQKWMAAIQKVADVPMSARHSVTLQEIRDNEPSGDDDSMFYEDVATSGTTPAAETTATAAPVGREAGSDEGEELYDDTLAEGENLYEAVGSVQSTVAAQPGSSTPIEEINYEISATQASGTTEPVEEENYDVPEEQKVPALPPARQSKSQPQPVGGENARIAEDEGSPAPPPPRPFKGHPQPEQKQNYEVPEEQRLPSPPPPRPTKPKVAEETYEIAEEQRQPTPSVPRQHRPPPEPIQDENYEVPEEQRAAPPPPRPSKPKPLVQDEEYEVPGQDDPLPPPPPAPLIEEENYEEPEEKPAAPPRPIAAKRKPPAPQPKETIPEQPKRPAPRSPLEEAKNLGLEQNGAAINYANVYQALWNCEQDDDDELPFQRGDLIYIYEKPHSDWWIGSLFKPQGDRVGLVPSQYVMEAYA